MLCARGAQIFLDAHNMGISQIGLNLEAAKATIEKSLKKKEIKQEAGANSAGGIDLTTPMKAATLMEHLGASIMATVIQVHHNDL